MDFFTLEVKDNVGIVTFERRPVNAINMQCQEELRALVEQINERDDIHVAILQAGDVKGFCAGIDIKENHTGADIEGFEKGQARALKTIAALQSLKVPLITATKGFVMGFGVALLACSDIIICADDTKISVSEVKLGHVGATATISTLVPPRVARYMSYTGNPIPPEDLVRYGSVLKVVPREQLLDAALEVANDIACRYTKTVQFLKQVYTKHQDMQIPEKSFTERAYAVRLLNDPKREECVNAFFEKRSAKL